ncbi:hypothetical protein AB0J86_20470 [Micromonospora sp. NPDC049559]|uniref:hypothetical protein n=1 Tax=Micromonospora sp. NPDC049559 TaxID=3155923 RepID=UPI003419D87A
MSAVVVLLASGIATAVLPGASARASLDGRVDDPVVAVSSMSDTLQMFATGDDGSLHQKSFVDGIWSGWEDLGGDLTSAPATASPAEDRLDVFARSKNFTLVQRTYSGGVWSNWVDLGGSLTSAPTVVSTGAGRLDVFARGAGNGLIQRSYSGGTWSTWVNLGGDLASAPSVTSSAVGRLDVLARGADDSLLYRAHANNAWSGWTSLSGPVTSAPSAVSNGVGRIDVVAQGPGNVLRHRYLSGAWSNWSSLAIDVTSAPTARTKGPGLLTIWALNGDGNLYQYDKSLTAKPRVGLFAQFSPQVPKLATSRTVARQQRSKGESSGPIDYAYVSEGRLVQGYQSDPFNPLTVQWREATLEARFARTPELGQGDDDAVRLAALDTDGDVRFGTRSAQNPLNWQWDDAGGWASSTSTGRLPDGRLVLFAVDRFGQLWHKRQASSGGPYLSWQRLDGIRLVASPKAMTALLDLQLFATGTDGRLQTASYSGGGLLSGWTALSEPGQLVGEPSVMVLPGYHFRVVGRAPDGTVLTKKQDYLGAYPAEWTAVGGFVAAGQPAAVLSWAGFTVFLARGADGQIYKSVETVPASGQWRPWEPASEGILSATDPTGFAITERSGEYAAYVFRTSEDRSFLFIESPQLRASARQGGPVFTGNPLPAPPQ